MYENVWNVNFVEYDWLNPADQSQGLIITILHWDLTGSDPLLVDEDNPAGRAIGTQDVRDQEHEYLGPSAEVDAQSTTMTDLVNWCLAGMGLEEQNAHEANVLEQWEQNTVPDGGGFPTS